MWVSTVAYGSAIKADADNNNSCVFFFSFLLYFSVEKEYMNCFPLVPKFQLACVVAEPPFLKLLKILES